MNTKLTTKEILKKIAGVVLILIGSLIAFSLVKQLFSEPSHSYDAPPPAGYYGISLALIFVCFKYGLKLYNGPKQDESENVSYECTHCNYKSETDFIYCPQCKKDDNGLTIEEVNQNKI